MTAIILDEPGSEMRGLVHVQDLDAQDLGAVTPKRAGPTVESRTLARWSHRKGSKSDSMLTSEPLKVSI